MCRIDTATAGTCNPVKHPERDFRRPVRPTACEIASKYRHTRFVDHLMDINRSAKPRVPAIKNLAPVVNVGVLTFSCTTPVVRIHRLTAEHPIRPISTNRCPKRKRRNQGGKPLRKRQQPVQINRTTSDSVILELLDSCQRRLQEMQYNPAHSLDAVHVLKMAVPVWRRAIVLKKVSTAALSQQLNFERFSMANKSCRYRCVNGTSCHSSVSAVPARMHTLGSCVIS